MKKHQIAYLIVLALLVLAPVQAEATSHYSSLTKLCAKSLTCGPVLGTILPKIAQADSPITPGGYVVIQGSGFGQQRGELYLTGLWEHPVGDSLAAVKSVKLTVPIGGEGWDFWQPGFVLGFVPDSITQVGDQPVKLRIKTKDNKWSNEYPVNFRATREVKLLPYTDPAVKPMGPDTCGTDSNFDVCNNWGDPDDGGGFYYSCGQTFFGYHYNVWAAPENDTGIDTFEITLKNGWVFDSMPMPWMVNVDPGQGLAVGPSGFPQGKKYWKPQVQWTVTANDSLCHGADISVAGPIGVPWK